MSYIKATDFAIKDTLPTGNPAKTVTGTGIDDEFNAIETDSIQLNSRVGTAETNITSLTSTKAAKAGDTYTGAHNFTGGTVTVAAPAAGANPTTKTYVDDQDALKASLSGAIYTGAHDFSGATSVSMPSNTVIGSVSATEIGYLDGATSSIQTQINTKSNLAGGNTITGVQDFTGATVSVAAPTLGAHAVTKTYTDALSVAAGNAPLGGTTGQALTKASNTNYDMVWADNLSPSAIGVSVQAYDADIATVAASQAEMEAGTEVGLRSMSPLRIAQAIAEISGEIPISTRTSNSILAAADKGKLIDATTAGFTQTLTAAATLTAGWWCYYRNSAGSGNVTLDPNGAETIDGAATLIVIPGSTVLLVCDGSNFFVAQRTNQAYTGTGSAVLATGPTLTTPNIGAATGTSLSASGLIKSSSTSAGIGYASSASGTVAQATSATTAVTINNVCGRITLFDAQITGGTTLVTFIVNNSTVAAGDTILLSSNLSPTNGEYVLASATRVSAGAFTVAHGLLNNNVATGGTRYMYFTVIKGS